MARNRTAAGNLFERENRVTAMRYADQFTVKIENIGGITHEKRTLPVGVTPLVGANATKRSSFLAGIMAGLGSTSDAITVNTAADEGRVDLTVNSDTFTRTVRSTGGPGGRVFNGAPVVEDPDAAEKLDLYAFLHGENEVRDVIESDGDVYDVLMRPVDTDAIEDRIAEIKARKREINDELDAIEQAKDDLVHVANEVDAKAAQKDQLLEERDEVEAEISELEAELETVRGTDEKTDAEERLETLEDTIDELEEDQSRVTGQIDGWKETKAEAEDELAELDSTAGEKDIDEITDELREVERDVEGVDASIQDVEDAKQEIDKLIDAAVDVRAQQDVFETITDVLRGESMPDGPVTFTPGGNGGSDRGEGGAGSGGGDVTAGLIGDDDAAGSSAGDGGKCLVCGQATVEEQIRDVIEQYRGVRTQLQNRLKELKRERRELQETRSELQDQKQRREQVSQQRDELEDELSRASERLAELRSKLKEIESELDAARSERDSISLEAESGKDSDGEDAVAEVQTALTDARDERRRVDREYQRMTDKLDRLEDRRDELEAQIADEDEFEAELEEIDAEHDELRGRVEQKETELVDQFNTHMETVVDAFGYTNLERVWIERKRDGDASDTSAKNSTFDVNVIRTDSDGKVHESRVAHLSESERAVTGILVAVTGYVVHDVADICPVMILDSIEMIDGERVAALLAFLDEQAGSRWTIAALLPDHMTDVTDDVVTGTERFTETGDVTLR